MPKPEYTIDIKLGFIYRKRYGGAIVRINPHEDRGKDDFQYKVLISLIAEMLSKIDSEMITKREFELLK